MKTVRVFKPEDRICKECGETFFADKPSWVCRACFNKAAKRKAQELAEMGMQRWIPKDKYPMEENAKKRKFDRLRSKLNKMHFRHEWKEFLSARLDEVLADEKLIKWVYDRRDGETMKANKKNKYSIDIKKMPSTKNVNLDDF